MSDKRLQALPAYYSMIYPVMVEAGRVHGYAMALHGSLARDMDVIAVPWTEDASPASVMVEHVVDRIGALTMAEIHPDRDPELKPHGRLAWTLLLNTGAFIDLSVMPTAHQESPHGR